MAKRERDLHQLSSVQRALVCGDRRAVHHEITLRVVREFGLPDMVADILSNVGQHCEVVQERRKAEPIRDVQNVPAGAVSASALVTEETYSQNVSFKHYSYVEIM